MNGGSRRLSDQDNASSDVPLGSVAVRLIEHPGVTPGLIRHSLSTAPDLSIIPMARQKKPRQTVPPSGGACHHGLRLSVDVALLGSSEASSDPSSPLAFWR